MLFQHHEIHLHTDPPPVVPASVERLLNSPGSSLAANAGSETLTNNVKDSCVGHVYEGDSGNSTSHSPDDLVAVKNKIKKKRMRGAQAWIAGKWYKHTTGALDPLATCTGWRKRNAPNKLCGGENRPRGGGVSYGPSCTWVFSNQPSSHYVTIDRETTTKGISRRRTSSDAVCLCVSFRLGDNLHSVYYVV